MIAAFPDILFEIPDMLAGFLTSNRRWLTRKWRWPAGAVDTVLRGHEVQLHGERIESGPDVLFPREGGGSAGAGSVERHCAEAGELEMVESCEFRRVTVAFFRPP